MARGPFVTSQRAAMPLPSVLCSRSYFVFLQTSAKLKLCVFAGGCKQQAKSAVHCRSTVSSEMTDHMTVLDRSHG